MSLVFVDIETTGLDPAEHEVIEVAAIRVDAAALEIEDEASFKVNPVAIEKADPKALEINGYSEELWEDAVSLEEALQGIAPLLDGAVLAGHHVSFDWSFLEPAFQSAGVEVPNLSYRRVDTESLTWLLQASGETDALSLDAACEALGIERPSPHRALDDARASLEVARAIYDRFQAGKPVTELVEDERPIIELLLERIEAGREDYGPWDIDDDERDFVEEALEEVIDALHYAAAALLRVKRERGEA